MRCSATINACAQSGWQRRLEQPSRQKLVMFSWGNCFTILNLKAKWYICVSRYCNSQGYKHLPPLYPLVTSRTLRLVQSDWETPEKRSMDPHNESVEEDENMLGNLGNLSVQMNRRNFSAATKRWSFIYVIDVLSIGLFLPIMSHPNSCLRYIHLLTQGGKIAADFQGSTTGVENADRKHWAQYHRLQFIPKFLRC